MFIPLKMVLIGIDPYPFSDLAFSLVNKSAVSTEERERYVSLLQPKKCPIDLTSRKKHFSSDGLLSLSQNTRNGYLINIISMVAHFHVYIQCIAV